MLLCATHSLKFISEVTLFSKFATLSYMFIKLSFSFQTNKISSQVKITYLTIPDIISQLRKEKQKNNNIIIRKKKEPLRITTTKCVQSKFACPRRAQASGVWGGGRRRGEGGV